MPNSEYSLVFGTSGFENVSNKTASGFTLTVNGTATPFDAPSSFAVFSSNALPPKGGTGTDSWATVKSVASNGTCDVPASFNTASVTRTAVGKYAVVFNTPMPSANYAVQLTCINDAGARQASVNDVTTTGFTAQIFSSAGAATDKDFTFTVNATNATLPQTVTQEQIDAAINNPGASAWGNVDTNGNLVGGLNCSATGAGGDIDITFLTPMPNANYAVTLGTSAYNSAIRDQTATGFKIITDIGGSDTTINTFTVFATNALPPKGGTGTDAWGAVQADGTIDASFNVASVTKSATGTYDVVFTSPMPSSSYAVAVNIMEDANSTSTKFAVYYNLTTTGFSIKTKGGSTFTDLNFSFSVNATNATLPATFTATQITNMISGLTAIKNAALNNSTDLAGMKASIAAALANF